MAKYESSQLRIETSTKEISNKVGPIQLLSNIKHKLQEHRKMKQCEHVFNQLTDKELRDLGFYRYGSRFFPLDD